MPTENENAELDTPTSYEKMIAEDRARASADYARMIAEEQNLNKRIQESAAAQAKERAPYFADVERAGDEATKAAERYRPRLQSMPRPPSTEEMTRPSNLQRTFGMAAVFSLLAAGITKGASTEALSALGGFMKGAREGNMEQAKNAIADFNMKMDYTLEQNKVAEKNYENILLDKKMTLEQKERALKLKMLEQQDQQWLLQLEQKGMTSIHALMNQRNTLNHQMAGELYNSKMLQARMAHWTAQDTNAANKTAAAGGVNTVLGIPIAQIPTVEPGQKNTAFLAMLPPAQAQLVQRMAEGKLPVSGFGGLDVKSRSELVKAASLYDPSSKANKYAIDTAVQLEYTPKGATGQNILAINTMAHHIDDFAEAFSKLDNSQVQKWNDTKNKLAANFGDPALQRVQVSALMASGEFAKVIKGGRAAPTDQEMAHWEQVFSTNLSPTQMRAVVWQALQGAGGRLSAIEGAYQKETGENFGALYPDTQKIIAKWKPKSTPTPSWLGGGEGGGTQIKSGGTLTTEEARSLVQEIRAAKPGISNADLRSEVAKRAKELGKTW